MKKNENEEKNENKENENEEKTTSVCPAERGCEKLCST